MKAVVFSNFPPRVFESQIEPKLVEHGVEVVRMVKADTTTRVDLSKADAVIIMVDMVMSGHRKEIRDLARNAGKQVIALERRTSAAWGRALASDRESSPYVVQIEPVPDDKIEAFLAQFANHVEMGEEPEAMVEMLKVFWTGRPLTNERQLAAYIKRIKDDPRCPEAFKVWLGLHPEAFHLKRKRPEPLPPPPSARPSNTNSEVMPASAPMLPREDTVEDLKTMVQLYEDENARLLTKIESLEMTVNPALESAKLFQKEAGELRAEVARLKQTAPELSAHALTDLKAVVTSLKELVRTKVMTADEAFDRLAKFWEGR
jgi:hypothetical protein